MSISYRTVHWYIPIAMGLWLTSISLLQIYYFQVNDWDFSYFLHIPWSIAQGAGLVAPFALPFELPFYAHHATPLIAVLAPLFALFPSPYLLALLHGIAISCCFFLVPVLVREIAHAAGSINYLGIACFLLCILFCFRPFIAAWYYETHMTTLVTPCVFAALVLLHRKKMWGVGLCCLALVLAQERASVAVACLGMYAFLLLGMRTAGVVLCAFSSIYFFCAIKIYFPMVRSALGSSIGYAFSGAIDPLHDVYTKIMYILKYCAYTLCLPFAGKKAFLAALCALPLMGMSIISSRGSMYGFLHHYQDLSAPFFIASAAYGLFWICAYMKQIPLFETAVMRTRVLTMCACVCIMLSLFASRYQNPVGVSIQLLRNAHIEQLGQLNTDIQSILALDNTITVYAQSSIGPRIALRHNRYTLTSTIVNTVFTQSLIIVSPLVGHYLLDNYDHTVESLERNSSLKRIVHNPRLSIFASTDMPDSVVQQLQQ